MKTNLDRIKNDIESLSNCNLTPEDGLTCFPSRSRTDVPGNI